MNRESLANFGSNAQIINGPGTPASVPSHTTAYARCAARAANAPANVRSNASRVTSAPAYSDTVSPGDQSRDALVVTRDRANDGSDDRAGGRAGARARARGIVGMSGYVGEGDARGVRTLVVATRRDHGRGGRVVVGGRDRGGGSEERVGDGGIAAAVVEVERAVDVEGVVADGGDATREVSERSGRVRAECSAVVGMGERVPAPRRRVRGRRHGRVALAHHHVEEGEHRVESLALVRSLGRVPDPLLHQERADGGDPRRERLEVQAFSAGEHRRRETTRHDRSRRLGRRATGGVHRDRARGLDRHRVWRQARVGRWVTSSRGPLSDRPPSKTVSTCD